MYRETDEVPADANTMVLGVTSLADTHHIAVNLDQLSPAIFMARENIHVIIGLLAQLAY